MGEDEVGESGHEVEFVVFGRGDEDDRYGAGHGMVHLCFGKTFVSGEFVRGFEGCDEVDEENVGVVAVFEGFGPIAMNQEFVFGLEGSFCGFFDIFVVGDEHKLHGVVQILGHGMRLLQAVCEVTDVGGKLFIADR